MKVEKLSNSPNFGLRAQTHEFITYNLARNYAHLNSETADMFAKFVQKPDFDETGLKILGKATCNNHFYYPPQTYRRRESHLDFDGKHNAFSKYNEHICRMFTCLSKHNKKGAIEEAARAKHFLDDMSVGLHVKRGTVLDKYKEERVHKEFEAFIEDNQDKFYNNRSKSDLKKYLPSDNNDFDDLFVATVKTSLENEIPNEANSDRWSEIAQKTINLNIDSSREFFKLFLSLFG